MSNVAGQIYFIAEEHSITAPPVRVKIGLVRESKSGRDSQDRLLDHQTGNPRKLKLLKVVETARVSRVENSLHQRYAGQRGIGEWFELSDSELQAAIAECQDLASQQALHLKVIREAEQIDHAPRSSTIATASEEAREWHRRFLAARAAESLLNKLTTSYREKVKSAHERGVDVGPYARIVRPRLSFDSWLSKHHNEVFEACKQISTTTPFVPKSVTTTPDLESGVAQLVSQFQEQLNEWSLESGLDSLYKLYLSLSRPRSVWGEEAELAKDYLKVLCGQNRAIEGICAWTTSSSKRFSSKIAQEKHPQLFDEYAALAVYGAPQFTLRGGGDGEG
jgi:hypothetical protein